MVATWPGMGGVAQIAGMHLVRTLGARVFAELDAGRHYEPTSVGVHAGLLQPLQLPRTVLHAWTNPHGTRDLIVVLGEQQPAHDVRGYTDALLDVARSRKVERVVTFAALGTPSHPAAEPRVFAAYSRTELESEMRAAAVLGLADGSVGGLNGVFIAAAAARDFPALCLLGEFPYFAANVPNPKASMAVLRAFSRLSGINVDTAPLEADAAQIERGLVKHLETLQRASESEREGADEQRFDSGAAEVGAVEPEIEPKLLERIEFLFAQAQRDRSKALELKAELDRHGLFARFEDRFLDLFKQGG